MSFDVLESKRTGLYVIFMSVAGDCKQIKVLVRRGQDGQIEDDTHTHTG